MCAQYELNARLYFMVDLVSRAMKYACIELFSGLNADCWSFCGMRVIDENE